MKTLPHVSTISLLLYGILFVQGIYFGVRGLWSEVFVVVTAAVLSSVPYALDYYYNIILSEKVRVGIILFTTAAMVLGGIYSFYDRVWWWDLALHFAAGFGLAYLGYVVVYAILKQTSLRAAPVLYTVFIFSLVTTFLMAWELFEFSVDLLGLSENPMQPSLLDTMVDMIVGMLAAAIFCTAGYRMLALRKKNFVHAVVAETSV